VSDLAVSPNYDNLRHLGKITRYWWLHSNNIGCRRFWGRNYVEMKNSKGKTQIYRMDDTQNQQTDNFDFGVGLSIASVCSIVSLAIVSKLFRPLMCVIIIATSLKFLKSNKVF